jgi:hypothetical protein
VDNDFDSAELLRNVPEFQVGLSLPAPLSGRLDVLLARADEAGQPTSRKELVAALLLAAPSDEDKLARLILRYRKARVADAIIDGEDAGRILSPSRPPGRRPRDRDRPPRRR